MEAHHKSAAPPGSPVEEELVRIWAEELKLDPATIGVDDDFFGLGGDSLEATVMLGRVSAAFAEVSIAALLEGPTIAELARRIEKSHGPRLAPLTRADRTGPFPLSFGQERLVLHHRLHPEARAAYNIPLAVRLSGPLDSMAFANALVNLVRWHEALRTTFARRGDHTVQVVAAVGEVVLEHEDRDGPEGLADRIAELAKLPFDLDCGPLFSARLIRLGEEDHLLFLCLHHAICDGWSARTLLRDLGDLYKPGGIDRAATIGPLVHYGDFADWQRQRWHGLALEETLDYWAERLRGVTSPELPSDRPRPPRPSSQGGVHRFTVPGPLVDTLDRLAHQEGVTRFVVLLAAFQTLLWRYTGGEAQSEILVGVPIANRDIPELRGAVGYFASVLGIVTQLSPGLTFRDLLGRAKQSFWSAYSHRHLPFDAIVHELRRTRGLPPLRHPPLFSLQNLPVAPPAFEGLRAELDVVAARTARFDLSMGLQEAGHELTGAVEFAADLFDPGRIARFVAHYLSILEDVSTAPDRSLEQIAMIGQDELAQLRRWGNLEEVPGPADPETLVSLFEAQAERTPDRIAVVAGDREITYGELNRRANQVAHLLLSLGTRPEELIGIALDRSLALVAGVLGVLKSGSAYLPLDPAYPTERLRMILDEAAPRALLAAPEFLDRFPGATARVLSLDDSWEAIQREETGNPPPAAAPDDLAYVLYTSGSTGRPKGIALEHRNAVSLLRWAEGVYDDEDLAGVLAGTSLNFDLSVFELFVTLTRGGRVLLARNTLDWHRLPNAREVTLLNTVPSILTELLRQPGGLPGWPRVVQTAGELMTRQLADDLLAHRPQSRLYNLSGPTEDTTFSTCHRVRAGEPSNPPIGPPLPGTRAYVLGLDHRFVPAGVPGELYLAGAGLARGYFKQVELTSERFLPDPFVGGRMYKTGDLVRWLPGGELDFVGRSDFQVKVRGFRVEPGDVESALVRHPAVARAAVVAEQARHSNRLVGYVELKPGAITGPEEIRSFIASRLPDYMVPSVVRVVAEMERLPNGKVDRSKLLAVADGVSAAGRPPQTETEEVLAGIFARILEQPEDSIDVVSDFAELGGDSLDLHRLEMQIEAVFHGSPRVSQLPPPHSVAALALALSGSVPVSGEPDPWREVHTFDFIPSSPPPTLEPHRIVSPGAVLLTGATGFLGAFLLDELLRGTNADVYCLVRPRRDGVGGGERLRSSLARYGLLDESTAGRIRLVEGDLSLPEFGLAPGRFEELARSIDAIYHNGAYVSFVHTYAAHRPANVLGTVEVLRLATLGQWLPTHYVSTISVCGAAVPGDIDEDTPLDRPDRLSRGYPRSKWVAEQLVRAAARRGLPVTIHRPGRVTGHTGTGSWKTDDFACSLLKGCIRLGVYPDLAQRVPSVDVTPVDYVTRSLVHLSLRAESLGRTFHLINPRTTAFGLVIKALERCGYELAARPYPEWRAALAGSAETGDENPLRRFLSALPEYLPADSDAASNRSAIHCPRTLEALSGSGIEWPVVDESLIGRYVEYFRGVGFLPPPRALMTGVEGTPQEIAVVSPEH